MFIRCYPDADALESSAFLLNTNRIKIIESYSATTSNVIYTIGAVGSHTVAYAIAKKSIDELEKILNK